MKVTVQLFARARDLAGASAVMVDLPEGATVADLRGALAANYPALGPILERSAVAVDNDFAEDGLVLPSSPEIALLPPVSGG
jgi:molybdopterin converting factor small subunit